MGRVRDAGRAPWDPSTHRAPTSAHGHVGADAQGHRTNQTKPPRSRVLPYRPQTRCTGQPRVPAQKRQAGEGGPAGPRPLAPASRLQDGTCASGTSSELTWILPWTPVLSILLATLTVFPQMSYCGLRAPITPATTGPTLMPARQPRSAISTGKASEKRSCPSRGHGFLGSLSPGPLPEAGTHYVVKRGPPVSAHTWTPRREESPISWNSDPMPLRCWEAWPFRL